MSHHTPSALVLIEYQNEWLAPQGKLRNWLIEDRELIVEAVRNSTMALAAARNAGLHIIHVTLSPDACYRVLGAAKFGLRAAIPKAGTWQAEMQTIHPDFAPREGEYVIRERAGASAFAGTTLDAYLRNNRVADLYLMGFATHVCVESTLRQAHDLGYDTRVIVDATAAFNRMQQDYFAKAILHHFGAGVTARAFSVATAARPFDSSRAR